MPCQYRYFIILARAPIKFKELQKKNSPVWSEMSPDEFLWWLASLPLANGLNSLSERFGFSELIKLSR